MKAAIGGLLLGLLAATPDATAAAYQLTYFRFPGTLDTTALDINDAGQIVGNYYDGTAVHGYIGRPGAFTSLDRPLSGINNRGQIVGPTPDRDGFYILDGGTVSTYTLPRAENRVTIGDINDRGQVTGNGIDATNDFKPLVFVAKDGVFSTTPNSTNGTYYDARGIDNAGNLAGTAYSGDPDYNQTGFLGQPGAFKILPGPAGRDYPTFGKLSSDGVLIGVAYQSVFFNTIRVTPFEYRNGALTLLDLGISTLPYRGNLVLNSVNIHGEVVGTEYSNGTLPIGVLATPIAEVAEPASLSLLAGGLALLGIAKRRRSTPPPPHRP